MPGCFFVLGGETLRALDRSGYLGRSQACHGLLFNDDLILTACVYALRHPVVDLSLKSSHWGSSMFMSEETPLEVVLRQAPYVVHPLKNNTMDLLRREELHDHCGLGSVLDR